MSLFGGPARYTGLVFAEDEEHLPKGWDPLSVDQGFTKGGNIVTLHNVSSTDNRTGIIPLNNTQAEQLLNIFADNVRIGGRFIYHAEDYSFKRGGAPGVQVLPYTNAQGLSDLGWTKEKVKAYVWEKSKVGGKPFALKPQNLMFVVAGGAQGMHSYWMDQGCCDNIPVSKVIQLPAKWDNLLKQAEKDLGPPPAGN
jgi:hypothetical protein